MDLSNWVTLKEGNEINNGDSSSYTIQQNDAGGTIKVYGTIIDNFSDIDTSQVYSIGFVQGDEAPVITGNDYISIDENISTETVIYNAEATDINNDNITFSVSGTDEEFVEIDSDDGEVRLINSPDFETKPQYLFNVVASDGILSSSKTITINVNDIYENIAPEIISSQLISVEENISVDTVVYNIQANDTENDPIQFSLSGIDAHYLNIDSESGEVFLNSSPNYELKSSYSFNVVASDDLGSNAKSVTLNIEDIDESFAQEYYENQEVFIDLLDKNNEFNSLPLSVKDIEIDNLPNWIHLTKILIQLLEYQITIMLLNTTLI